jgi:hypothetical protein
MELQTLRGSSALWDGVPFYQNFTKPEQQFELLLTNVTDVRVRLGWSSIQNSDTRFVSQLPRSAEVEKGRDKVIACARRIFLIMIISVLR